MYKWLESEVRLGKCTVVSHRNMPQWNWEGSFVYNLTKRAVLNNADNENNRFLTPMFWGGYTRTLPHVWDFISGFIRGSLFLTVVWLEILYRSTESHSKLLLFQGNDIYISQRSDRDIDGSWQIIRGDSWTHQPRQHAQAQRMKVMHIRDGLS